MAATRVLIVDDEPLARQGLRMSLEEMDGVEVAGECADGDEAVAAIRDGDPDVVLLDVQMPERNGLDVVRAVGVDAMPVTIFVTAYDEYAVQAFEAQALDYLLKPVDEERLAEAIDRAQAQIRQHQAEALSEQLQSLLQQYSAADDTPPVRERFTIRSRGRIYFVDVEDIRWIESEGDYVALHDGEDEHLIRETMKTLEEELDADRFLRIHRSTIVNAEYIAELRPRDHGTYDVLLDDGTRLRTSRSYSDRIDALLDV
jgi:two-component system LytT family response regulator